MEEKIANHACMNEQFFLEFHMARSNIEMQRKRNQDGGLNRYGKIKEKPATKSEKNFAFAAGFFLPVPY